MMTEGKPALDGLSDEQKTATIPYYVHEYAMYRMDRLNRRWFIAFLLVLCMLFVTNAGWIIYENQFEDVRIVQEADTDSGGNNYLNGTGEMWLNGEGETDNSDSPQEDRR